MNPRPLLRQAQIFRQLNETEGRALERTAQIRYVERGAALFNEGDPATGLFVLLTGRIKICRSAPDGRSMVLHFVDPGQIFAEAAAIELGEYPASAIALEDSAVAFFGREEFIELIRVHPAISLKVMGGLARWIREFVAKIEELTTRDVSTRLARYLLNQATGSRPGSDLPVADLGASKGDVAASIGTVNETLSRCLRRFRDLEIIEVDGNLITILAPDRLRQIADT